MFFVVPPAGIHEFLVLSGQILSVLLDLGDGLLGLFFGFEVILPQALYPVELGDDHLHPRRILVQFDPLCKDLLGVLVEVRCKFIEVVIATAAFRHEADRTDQRVLDEPLECVVDGLVVLTADEHLPSAEKFLCGDLRDHLGLSGSGRPLYEVEAVAVHGLFHRPLLKFVEVLSEEVVDTRCLSDLRVVG